MEVLSPRCTDCVSAVSRCTVCGQSSAPATPKLSPLKLDKIPENHFIYQLFYQSPEPQRWRFIFNLNLSGILSTGSLLSSISVVIPPIRVATMEDWDPITNIYILPSMAPASPLPRPRVGSQPLALAQQAPSLIHSLHFLY